MKTGTSHQSRSSKPWLKPWPKAGVESISKCPVCGKEERELLYSKLIDNTFRVSPGKWGLWQCSSCQSAYLDPRPSPDTISLAYERYYTHQESEARTEYKSLGILRRFRRVLVNGYTNWRYLTNAQPSSPVGVLAAFAIPRSRRILDRQYRHLPRRSASGGSLLDVGCGDSTFLRTARACGWKVIGLDPDQKAAAIGKEYGITIHTGGVEYFDANKDMFDVITLNHVIEHVHNPTQVLEACYALLKPGGQLWIETPNIDSYGHFCFKGNWRGLEAPRHLVLFTRSSLCQAIKKAGFEEFNFRKRRNPIAGMFKASFALEKGLLPSAQLQLSRKLHICLAIVGVVSKILNSHDEFITVTSKKPFKKA